MILRPDARLCHAEGMPERTRKKSPRDTNLLAKSILDAATGDAPVEAKPEREKNPAAVALGKLGGAKGGLARAKALSSERRREISQRAARARWKKSPPKS